ncbi:uncharacterized protein LOC108194790 [Daucus carota subsp. sativus]|nr:PREDICTED: uncharacterized protein LOC108194790 [Daucus carota subsp. sativus]
MESQTYANPPNIFSSETTSFWLFKLAFFISSILLSLVSTSAVVFTVACIYSAKETTYKKVMKVVPKVLKGLLITFFWIFIISFAVIMGVSLIIFLVVFLVVITSGVPSTPGVPVMILLLVFGGIILLGILYMSLVWQLANIVSVLEDVHGIQAMKKSKNLIKGNSGLCAAVLVVLNLCFLGIDLGFKASVVGGDSVWGKILHACLWAMLMSILSLLGLVIQTIIYFVCKSYHGETIGKSSLAHRLEVFHKDYDQLDSQEEVSMV